MAVIQDKVQIGSSSDFLDGVSVDTPAGTDLFRETVVLADPENGGGLANIRQLSTDLVATDRGIVTNTVIHGLTTAGHGSYVDVKVTPSGALTVEAQVVGEVSIVGEVAVTQPVEVFDGAQSGSWGYLAGVDGSVSVPALSRVLQISASASTALAASFTINGGQSIPIPIGQAVTLEPKGNLVAPTLVFSSTASYLVEYVS